MYALPRSLRRCFVRIQPRIVKGEAGRAVSSFVCLLLVSSFCFYACSPFFPFLPFLICSFFFVLIIVRLFLYLCVSFCFFFVFLLFVLFFFFSLCFLCFPLLFIFCVSCRVSLFSLLSRSFISRRLRLVFPFLFYVVFLHFLVYFISVSFLFFGVSYVGFFLVVPLCFILFLFVFFSFWFSLVSCVCVCVCVCNDSRFLLRHTQSTPQVFITSSHVYFRSMRVFTCSARCFLCWCYGGRHLSVRLPVAWEFVCYGLVHLFFACAVVLGEVWRSLSQLQPKIVSSASRNRTLPRHVLVDISVISCVSFCDYDRPSRE